MFQKKVELNIFLAYYVILFWIIVMSENIFKWTLKNYHNHNIVDELKI